jgi:hypothetical protein
MAIINRNNLWNILHHLNDGHLLEKVSEPDSAPVYCLYYKGASTGVEEEPALVELLEKEGLIESEPRDASSRHYRITEKGKEVLAEGHSGHTLTELSKREK